MAITTVALAAGCASRATPRTPTFEDVLERPGGPEQLRQDLRALFTEPTIDHAHWAVNVYSLQRGETLYSYNAFRFMVPASNQKLLTTAAAAERLGWDYRFTTRIVGTGPIDADGLLDGDLVVIGNGDPTINPRHPDRWRVFDAWSATLKERGVRIVRGNLVGDDNAFTEPGWGVGWSWDNLQYGYGAPVGALQYNENQIEVMVGPAMEPGGRANISTTPFGHGLLIDHQVVTVAAGMPSRVDIARMPGRNVLRVEGQVATDGKPITLTASVENPTQLFVNAFREALGRHGIYVAGNPVDIDDLRAPPDISRPIELVADKSPALTEIIDVTLKWSRNGYAETLLMALAPSDKPATGAAGLEVVDQTLASWGIQRTSYSPRDGSGLSRYDYVTADALTWLLTVLWSDPRHAELYRASLPVAGVSGTLAERMKGTPAEARVWAKTGTLSHVRGLSGYVVTLAGEPLVFSMLANNYRVSTSQIDQVMENALVRLVEFKR